ncbi:MAG TPA: hypothetical protein VLA89_02630 [Gemmatimonadales bacterium]|nr:hypothetical protein [Gemmatimonadales bacterium]
MRLFDFFRASREARPQVEFVPTRDGGAEIYITRGRSASEHIASMKANEVHACIIRANGSVEDLGIAKNLRTNAGADWQADTMGGKLGISKVASASSATSITTSGLTTDAHKGWRVYAENGTSFPVFGNVLSNTTTVVSVDAWYNPDGSAGSTPSSTADFILIPQSGAYFIALTTDTGAPAAGDTALTSEITTNGLQRAAGTYAHTGGTTSYTVSKTFNASGTHTGVHKAGLFTGGPGGALGGVMVFETNLNADATLASGDSLAVTWTVNI